MRKAFAAFLILLAPLATVCAKDKEANIEVTMVVRIRHNATRRAYTRKYVMMVNSDDPREEVEKKIVQEINRQDLTTLESMIEAGK